jgi:hypothetical protein
MSAASTEIFITERIVNERLRLMSEHKEPTTLHLGGQEYHDLLSFIHMSDQQCRITSNGTFFEGLKIKTMNKKSHFEFGYEDYES